MDERLNEKILKLPKQNIINLMWDALDEMQSYNGRTKQTCILEAMGAKSVGNKWRLPSDRQLKKDTEAMSPFND
jgi:hypothetical protein